MKRWGDGDRFLALIEGIRARRPDAAFRSSFIVGFPGETEDDHDALLSFLGAARLDWAGFFPFSAEDGTPAAGYPDRVPAVMAAERATELGEVQDAVTRARRDALVGTTVEVMVDAVREAGCSGPGGTRAGAVGRTFREAPEIDGVVRLTGPGGPDGLGPEPGAIVPAEVVGAVGPDLEAVVRWDGGA